MRIHLHIGAHKTATTYVQTRLLQERALLARHGVAVAPHADVRKSVADRLDQGDGFGGVGCAVAGRLAVRGIKRLIAAEHADDTLVVSDENIAGSIASAASSAGLYPDVGGRVGSLLAGLKGHDTSVFFSVRAYPDFFDSVYAFRAGQRKAPDADAFAAQAAAMTRGWPEIVADICRLAGRERVVVWTHETFRRDPQAVADALTGTSGLALFSLADRARLPSLTAKGMAVMERVSDLMGDEEYARFSRAVARFRFDGPDGRVAVLPQDVAARLAERYEGDLRAIEALGCRMVRAGD